MARETRSEGTGKAPYSAPALRLYGSVRDLTGDVSGAASDMTFATNAMGASDPAMKENVARVGDHPAGFGLYLFDYKAQFRAHGAGRPVGVRADVVHGIGPEAVSLDSDPNSRVDYERLEVSSPGLDAPPPEKGIARWVMPLRSITTISRTQGVWRSSNRRSPGR